MELIIAFAIGSVVGSVITYLATKAKNMGYIQIHTSDPDGPYLFLELHKDVKDIYNRKFVLFEVKRF